DLLARKGECATVTLWAREPEVVESVNREHVNHMFLPGAPLAATLTAQADVATAVREADVVVSAGPSHAVREVMTRAGAHLRGARGNGRLDPHRHGPAVTQPSAGRRAGQRQAAGGGPGRTRQRGRRREHGALGGDARGASRGGAADRAGGGGRAVPRQIAG